MERREFVSILGASSLAFVAGCSSEDSEPTQEPVGSGDSQDPTAETTERTTTQAPQSNPGLPFDSGKSHEFEGTGVDETTTFELSRGTMRYEYHVPASQGTFTSELVYMSDERGDLIDDQNLTNLGTPIQGEFVTVVSGGEYKLGIDTPGDWSVTIDQPSVAENDSADIPVTEDGDQPTYIGLINLPSDAEVTATKSSGDIFQFHTITPDGGWNLPINDSSQPEVTRTIRHEGLAFVNVVGTGEWSVTIE
ncbi:hypothetical protein PNP85_14280 [Halobacterium salinarum]|uniref:hypothetical protein n=1 Tax=Halobacterium salinarum TaxID=2242 RepID=UPI002555AF17|nr:hypothetical protein [Halobacterium salinarum]MDL0135457.1 hypothetical protein [Halobacterium salinarum]MDL0140669.1 hypothetical protein [Halobacterium salinarum]